LLDEPLSALDLKLRKEMQSELKRLQLETGLTFVFVTHDQGEALAISDQIAVMSQGKVQQIGTPQEIYARPRSRFVADFIGDTNIIRADLVECDGDQAVVKFDGEAQHRLPLLGLKPAIGQVHVAVHPESLTLTSPDASEAMFKGVVESSTYFGSGSMVHVQLDRGEVISVQVASKVNPGERVGLSAAVSDFQVLVD
jgi:spermidine/putrescine transport system ATP-binding protein